MAYRASARRQVPLRLAGPPPQGHVAGVIAPLRDADAVATTVPVDGAVDPASKMLAAPPTEAVEVAQVVGVGTRAPRRPMQVRLRRRLLEDAQGPRRQVAGDTCPTRPRADTTATGTLLGVERPAIGLADRVGGMAHVGTVAQATAGAVVPTTPARAAQEVGTTDGPQVAPSGQMAPFPVTPTRGPVRLGARVRWRVDDAVPIKVPRPVTPDAIAAIATTGQHPHAVPEVVQVDAAVPTARLAIEEVGVTNVGRQGPRVKGGEAGAFIA